MLYIAHCVEGQEEVTEESSFVSGLREECVTKEYARKRRSRGGGSAEVFWATAVAGIWFQVIVPRPSARPRRQSRPSCGPARTLLQPLSIV